MAEFPSAPSSIKSEQIYLTKLSFGKFNNLFYFTVKVRVRGWSISEVFLYLGLSIPRVLAFLVALAQLWKYSGIV